MALWVLKLASDIKVETYIQGRIYKFMGGGVKAPNFSKGTYFEGERFFGLFFNKLPPPQNSLLGALGKSFWTKKNNFLKIAPPP